MKKIILIFSFLIFAFNLSAQIDVSNHWVVQHLGTTDLIKDFTDDNSEFLWTLGTNHTIADSLYFIDDEVGSALNTGKSASSPWTLAKYNATTLPEGVAALFHRSTTTVGTVELKTGVSIGTYGNGSKANFKGTATVSGTWTLHSGNIYSIKLPTGTTNQLFANGVKMNVAASEGIDIGVMTEVTTKVNDSTFTATDLIGTDYTGAFVALKNTAYTLVTRKIIDCVPATGQITLESTVSFLDAGSADEFLISNYLPLLNEAGEWTLDASDSTLYFWSPDGTSPDNYTVEYSSLENGFFGDAISNVEVRNLEIKGFEGVGIKTDGACSYLKFDNNTISDCYLAAIRMSYEVGVGTTEANFSEITNNTISNCFAQGIFYQGDSCTIKGNTISNIGLFAQVGTHGDIGVSRLSAIQNFVSANSLISENTITDIGYTGIDFNGDNQEVSKNVITRACSYLQDGGAIYCYNAKYSIIKNNIITGSGAGFATSLLVYGIYIDSAGGSDYGRITIKDNTVYNCNSSLSQGLFVSNQFRIKVDGNVFYNNGDQVLIKNWESAYENRYDTIQNNIFYSLNSSQKTVWFDIVDSTLASYVLDNNGYYNTENTYSIYYKPDVEYNLSSWQTYSGKDASSTTLDTVITLYTPTDTLSANLAPNPTFDSDKSSWVAKEWVASSPIGTGGAIHDTITDGSTSTFITAGIGDSLEIYQYSFDIIAAGNDMRGRFINKASEYLEYFDITSTQKRQVHYFDANGGTPSTKFFAYGTGGDGYYVDNVTMYEVTADYTPPTEKSLLVTNPTLTPLDTTLVNHIGLNGIAVTDTIIPAYSSAIFVKQ